MTTTTGHLTAAGAEYLKRRAEIEGALEMLRETLDTLDAGQEADSRNWGYAGTAQHILNTLRTLIPPAVSS